MISLSHSAGLVSPVVAALCAVTAGTCAPADELPLESTAVMDVAAELAAVPYSPATTSPAIARTNLDASVQSASTRFERLGDSGSADALIQTLHLRATMLGSVSDLERALEEARTCVAQNPNDARSHTVLATALAALHRFEESVYALDVAASYGHDVTGDRGSLHVAQGVFEPELARRLLLADEHPSFQAFADLAPALAAAGRFEDADLALVTALEHYRDVSPFTVAWIQFQRGVIWGEAAGDSIRAEALYKDAVRLFPGYVTANVHLAEIEFENGDVSGAIGRLRAVSGAEDPEPTARLAEFLIVVDEEAALDATSVARAAWNDLLTREPLAFADHAAEFFLGAGHDPERALELAQFNLDNRETDRSFELAIDAALAVGDGDLACDYLALAGPERMRIGLVEARATGGCDGPS